MPSISVTPLNNGITLGVSESITGMLSSAGSYIYYTNEGNIYFQLDNITPAVLSLPAGFAITCASVFFDGLSNILFFGGSNGNYVFGTLDTTGTSTLSTFTYGTTNFTAVAFDVMSYTFTAGNDLGDLFSVDSTIGTVSVLQTLNAPSLPAGSTLVISRIVYDLTINNYLIVSHASANITTFDVSNYSLIFSGDIASLVSTEIIGRHLWLGAIGNIENSSGVKVPKWVIAGEDAKIYESDDGIIWTLTLTVDQAIQINSLTFNTWVFAAGLLYGIVLLSTNGKVWESSFDALIYSDVVAVEPA